METALSYISSIIDNCFAIVFIIVFFFSLNRCFLKDGQSRVKLFFLALLTNPYTVFPISTLLVVFGESFVISLTSELNYRDTFNMVAYDNSMSLPWVIIGGVLFMLLMSLFSYLVGKWLKAHNVSLVMFIYLMFGVVCSLSGETVSKTGSLISPEVQNILLNIVYIISVVLLYRFVIMPLSELTDRKRRISWIIFLIPLIIFIPFYYFFDFLAYKHDEVFSNFVVRSYSLIVLALFIWAFCVIIKNINATNAAIEAQYEAEHDKLTGLYNKGKYMMMKDSNFGSPGSIALYNFDVNNLKYINDNYGHEYGDELIIKAANSIHAVTSDKVFGFRMGGDEYAMVAVDVTENEAGEIRKRWEQALSELNNSGEVVCVMACGLKYCEGEFDIDEIFSQADEQMYLDKKARKEKGETSYLRNAAE